MDLYLSRWTNNLEMPETQDFQILLRFYVELIDL